MPAFSPRGYKNPATTGEINDPAFWKTVGENQDARYVEIKEDSEGALANSEAALGTLNAVRELAKQSESAAEQSSFYAYTANQTVQAYEPRITGIEAMAGLTPEEPTDGQTSTLISNEATLTRAALNTQTIKALQDYAGTVSAVPFLESEASHLEAIQAALDATPDGGTLIIPAGDYEVDGTLTVNQKDIGVQAHGARFTRTTNATFMTAMGAFEPTLHVATITETTVSANGSTQPSVTLELVGEPDWREGDVVKLVADNVIPEARPGTGGSESRVGQFMVVHSVAGSTATLIGSLADDYSEDPRVARMSRHSLRWEGGVLATDPTGIAGTWTTGGFSLTALLDPRVSMEIESSTGAGVQFAGCYGYTADLRVGYGKNNTSTGNYGYGIIDTASENGNARIDARRVRHAWTDDSPRVASGSALHRYGRSRNAVIAGRGIGCSDSAFDTHSCGEGHTFGIVTAVDCLGAALQLRGRNHRATGVTAIRTGHGVRTFAESEGGQSYGHVVENLVTQDVRGNVIRAYTNPTGHPAANTRELRPVHFRTITGKGVSGTALHMQNATVLMDAVTLVMAGDSSGSVALANNADVRLTNIVTDFRGNTSGTSIALLGSLGTNTVTIDGWDAQNNSDHSTRMWRAFNLSAETKFNAKGVRFNYRPNNVATDIDTAQFEWELIDGLNNSSLIASSLPDGPAALASIINSPDPVIVFQSPLTTNRTLGPMKTPNRRGQILVIMNATTNGSTLTIKNDSVGHKTLTKSGNDLVLTTLQNASFMYSTQNNAWHQIA